jgi:predicted nucleotidyltransferase
MVSHNISVPMEKIAEFRRKWKVQRFSFFGSVLREDFGPDSDVDVLVSFQSDSTWDLLDMVDMRDELTALFGRQVDPVEEEGLRNPFRRSNILSTRQVVYAP